MNKISKSIALQKAAIDYINNGKLKAAKEALVESVDLMPKLCNQIADDYLIELLKNGD